MEKIEDTDVVRENMATHNTLFNGMMKKDRIMDIINNFIMWSGDNKILAAYHQYFGVKKQLKAQKKLIMKEQEKQEYYGIHKDQVKVFLWYFIQQI